MGKSQRVRFLSEKWHDRVIERSQKDHSIPNDFSGVRSLLDFDPTPRHEYLDWICRTYVSESFLFEDTDRVKNTLTVFHRYKHRLPLEQRDIGRLKSEQDLWDIVERYTPKNGEKEPAEGKALKRQEKAKALSGSDILESSDLDDWIVVSPLTHFAARWWSKGTRWCTGMSNGTHYKYYSERGPLRILISPSGAKFQVHIATLTFCDAADRHIDSDKFLATIPGTALKLLQKDVADTIHTLGHFNSIPVLLRTETMIEDARRSGIEKAVTLAESKDGFVLKHLPSALSMWAYGIIDSASFNRHQHHEDIALFKDDEIISRYFSKKETGQTSEKRSRLVLFDDIKNCGDIEFIQSAVTGLMSLWEKSSGFAANNYAAVIGKHFVEFFTQDTWDSYLNQAALKNRNTSDFPINPAAVTTETADALAKHNLFTILPTSFLTSERVDIFVNQKPENINLVKVNGYDHMISDETIEKVARWKKGQGLGYIPLKRLTQELFDSVVEEFPTAIYHVNEKYLTEELVEKVVTLIPHAILRIPPRFVNEALMIKAVSAHGSLYQQLGQKWRTPLVTEAALRAAPNIFVNTDIELTYQQFLAGVKLAGSTLSRVPLIYRTVEMCLAALQANVSEGISHIPPRVLEVIRQSRNAEADGPFEIEEDRSQWKRRLSKRYAASDPIHSFFPDDSTVLPERLRKLTHADKAEIFTDPEGLGLLSTLT